MRPHLHARLFFRSFLLIAILILHISHAAEAQDVKKTSAGFLLQNGSDTITIERFTRGAESFEGRVMVQKQVPITYKATINLQNQLKRLQVQVLKPGMPEEAAVQQGATMVFKKDSVYIESQKGDATTKETIQTVPGALAYHPQLPMISLLEQIVMRARTKGGQQTTVPVFLLSSQGQTMDASIRFAGKDSAYVSLGSIQVALKVNTQGQILSGKTAAGQTIKRLQSVPDAAFATTVPDYSAPADAPYKAEQVRIQTKAGHVLAGTLTIPKNAGKKVPVVVTITGSSKQDRDHNTPYGGPYRLYRTLADELGRKGVAVLRMDDRGVGQSTGNFESATTAERADDIREGIQFVQTHPAINGSKIVLVGLSEGAAIAPMIASTNSKLNGIVLMAGPASTGEEIMKYQLQYQIGQAKELSAEEKEKKMQEAMQEIKKEAESNPWLRYFLNYDPIKFAKQVKQVPILILHGTTDKNVPPGDAKELAKTFKEAGNNDVTLRMFEGVNHIFLEDADGNPKKYMDLKSFELAPDVMPTIVDWIVLKTKDKKQ